eukprot:365319-Chlamydomonas_euryale.AAC.3
MNGRHNISCIAQLACGRFRTRLSCMHIHSHQTSPSIRGGSAPRVPDMPASDKQHETCKFSRRLWYRGCKKDDDLGRPSQLRTSFPPRRGGRIQDAPVEVIHELLNNIGNKER